MRPLPCTEKASHFGLQLQTCLLLGGSPWYFLLKNDDFLLENVDFLLKKVGIII